MGTLVKSYTLIHSILSTLLGIVKSQRMSIITQTFIAQARTSAIRSNPYLKIPQHTGVEDRMPTQMCSSIGLWEGFKALHLTRSLSMARWAQSKLCHLRMTSWIRSKLITTRIKRIQTLMEHINRCLVELKNPRLSKPRIFLFLSPKVVTNLPKSTELAQWQVVTSSKAPSVRILTSGNKTNLKIYRRIQLSKVPVQHIMPLRSH